MIYVVSVCDSWFVSLEREFLRPMCVVCYQVPCVSPVSPIFRRDGSASKVYYVSACGNGKLCPSVFYF